jgi:hypothetical protein
LKQINNQDDDSDDEQYMNETAADMNEQAEQPKHQQDDNDSPQHGYSFRLGVFCNYLPRA